MKNFIVSFAAAVLVVCLAGCASMMGLPQGSVQVGDYQGPFNGKFFEGTIEVQVYQAPDGTRPVFGRLHQLAEEGFIDFRGQVTGTRMNAQFTLADGTVTGELSVDGRTMSGTYKLTDPPFDQGTWEAHKQ